ncbi:MAG: hypothetical protein V4684_08735 [Pseudomonadota bacterium]
MPIAESLPSRTLQTQAADAPEVVWQKAVIDFAQRHQLPPDDVVAGARFAFRRVGFLLHYNVESDPQGLVVVMDLGEIPAETARHVHLEMLANNARGAAALLGYQGIFPGTNRGAHCVRLDLGKCGPPSLAISAMVVSLALSVDASQKSMNAMFDSVKEAHPHQAEATSQ